MKEHTPTPTNDPLLKTCQEIAQRAAVASRALATANGEQKNRWLTLSAQQLRDSTPHILEANNLDLQTAPSYGLSDAAIDRLHLDEKRIEAIAAALEEVAGLPDPVGEVAWSSRRPNGLEVTQVRVPIGVVFFIYESRPNVTVDAASLCVKSGNAIILRGGKEALHSNRALFQTLAHHLPACGLPAAAVQFVDTTDRAAVGHLLGMGDLIDLTIPRGGESLIRRVVAEATMPVLKHYDGNCHVYVDAYADIAMALKVVHNAKVQRPGVCNAAETLLVHRDIAPEFLPAIASLLQAEGVELRADDHARRLVPSMTPATPSDWNTEFLDKILAVAVVDSLQSAVDHITRHGSRHTEAIITSDLNAARQFVARVDTSCVLVNASTRFNDGGCLGLGAEIGISTDKFHARGPCGLKELTTTKWVVYGDGHIRT